MKLNNKGIPMQDRTRERILDAAEALFAEHGFANTSLRAITAKAGVNLAAVNYHFGSKEALIQQVFARRLVPLNRERLERLAALEAEGEADNLEAVLGAFIGPTFKSEETDDPGEVRFMRLLGRTHAGASAPLREFVHTLYAEVLGHFERALIRALPHVPKDELDWRVHFLLGSVSYTLAMTDTMKIIADRDLPDADNKAVLLQRLIRFLAGGLGSPLPGDGLGHP
jgi:AcrR family transcriptional regulator